MEFRKPPNYQLQNTTNTYIHSFVIAVVIVCEGVWLRVCGVWCEGVWLKVCGVRCEGIWLRVCGVRVDG